MNNKDLKTLAEAYRVISEVANQQAAPTNQQQPQAAQPAAACLACNSPLVAGKSFCTKCGFITDTGWTNPAVRKNFAGNYLQMVQAEQQAPQQPSVDQQQDALYNQQAATFMQNFGKPRA